MLSSVLNNKNTYLQAVGANVFLFGAMAFRMSLYRIAAAKKSGNTDALDQNGEIFYWEQQLCSEYAPVGSALALAFYLKFGNEQGKTTASKVAAALTLLWTTTRYIFHARVSVLPKALIVPTMVTNYLALFASVGVLIAA
jgi:hypothetical protein